jgi:hypothetical protein
MITTMSLRDSLLDSAKEVFETMAFMALEEVADEQEGPGLENETLLGTITFKGDLEVCWPSAAAAAARERSGPTCWVPIRTSP